MVGWILCILDSQEFAKRALPQMMLCDLCSNFDLHALYAHAAARARTTKPHVPGGDGFPEFTGFPNFYKHHAGLKNLHASAGKGCSLCTMIWRYGSRTLPPDIREGGTKFPEGEYNEPIYLGSSNWSPEAQGMPYLTVIQHISRGATRIIATFDVFAEQGNIHAL